MSEWVLLFVYECGYESVLSEKDEMNRDEPGAGRVMHKAKNTVPGVLCIEG